MIHGSPQATYTYQVFDEKSNKMIKHSIESPDTLAGDNVISAASLFRYLLKEHATFLKGTADLHSSNDDQPIPVEREEGLNTTIVEQSVSSGHVGKKKLEQEQSCGDGNEHNTSIVQGDINKEPGNLDEHEGSVSNASSGEGGEKKTKYC